MQAMQAIGESAEQIGAAVAEKVSEVVGDSEEVNPDD